MKVHEKLLTACWSHDIPHRELLELIRPVKGTEGKERAAIQDRIADYIETHYPYKPGREPKEEN